MNCPACSAPLAALEYETLEVDFCFDCGGVWLDTGELELLFGDHAITRGFLTAGGRIPSSEKPRRCPACRAKMEKQTTGGPDPVTYDHCEHGLWFDRGELASVLQHGSPSPGGEEVARFLREIFSGSVREP